MRKLLTLVVAVLATAFVTKAQSGLLANNFNSVRAGGAINLLNTGITNHLITWNVQGTVSSCTVALDSSADGVTWSAGGVIAGQTCTSNGSSATVNSNVNYVRMNVTAFSGTGSVTVTWQGNTALAGAGGLPAGPTSPTNGASAVLTCVTAATPCIPTWGLPGITYKAAVTGTSYTIDSGATSDRGAYIPRSNSGTAMTDTVPDAGGGNFTSGYFFCLNNVDASATDTLSRTSASQFAVGNSTLVNSYVINPGQTSCFIGDANNNWRLRDGTLSTSEPAAASVSPFLLTGPLFTGGSGTTTFPYAYINQGAAPSTWSTSGTGFGINTPNGFVGNSIDVHGNGGASLFSVRFDGRITAPGGVNASGGGGVLGTQFNSSAGTLFYSSTAPTIAGAGCGGSGAAIGGNGHSNGTISFAINVGTAPTSGGCTFTMPAAFTTWTCNGTDTTTNSTSVFLLKQTSGISTTSVTVQNFSDVAVATAPTAGDIWNMICTAY